MSPEHFPPQNSSKSLAELLRLAAIALTAEELLEFLNQLASTERKEAA
jgi:hypothetical protein